MQPPSPGLLSRATKSKVKSLWSATTITRRHALRLEREAVSTRSFAARNLLALGATRGRHGYWDLLSALESTPHDEPAPIAWAETIDPLIALGLGRVVSAQRLFPSDLYVARQLYQLVHDTHGPSEFSVRDWIDFIGLQISRGHLIRAEHLLAKSGLEEEAPYELACLRINLNNSREQDASRGSGQVAEINRMFQLDLLEPIALSATNQPKIDRIQCRPDEYCNDGPLVSVIMTHFDVGDALLTAVHSVLGQSWRNLELIIIDDCSPDDEFARIRGLQERDPRIRILQTQKNSGTYTARNLGLQHARGEFVTCHDSDDWSHPRKIERQVVQLLESNSIGNLSSWTRTSEDLFFERFSATGKYIYPNTSSLMFRREPVVGRIGNWDAVRTGADTEYYKRIELVFDEKLPILRGAPLSFGRTRTSALTSGTMGMGWTSSTRRNYQAAWTQWHRQITHGTAAAKLQMPGQRVFPAPETILPDSAKPQASHWDIVFVADLRDRDLAPRIAEEALALSSGGKRVAVCHLPALTRRTAGRKFVHESIQELLNKGCVQQVETDVETFCRLLIVRDPATLQFVEGIACNVRPDRLLIDTDELPSGARPGPPRYAITSVDSAARRLFECPAAWSTHSAPLRRKLREILPPDSIMPAPGLVTSSGFHEVADARSLPQTTAPAFGLLLPEADARWEDWRIQDERLFPHEGMPVRIVGGRPPEGWKPEGWECIGQSDFEQWAGWYATIHFVPYFPVRAHSERVTPELAAALAAGCVVFTPPSFSPLLGDAALHTHPDSVRSLATWLTNEPERWAAQSRRARRFAEEHLTHEAYARTINYLLSPSLQN